VEAFAAAAAEDCNMEGMGALEHRRVVKGIVVEALDTVVAVAPSLARRIEVVVAVAELASLVVVAAAVPTTMTMMHRISWMTPSFAMVSNQHLQVTPTTD
jgi:hypothetical protein